MTITIGTRGSPLALVQAHDVRARLMQAHGLAEDAFNICVIKTSGDQIQDRPLADVGGKGLFTKEIEDALGEGDIDLAVHSMKDVATQLPPGMVVDCILPREDVRDAFISLNYRSFDDLPHGATVGTSSLRRQAQVQRRRPDLNVIMYRGNVQTRLRRLADGVADATLLACAGLNRLGMSKHITAALETDDMLPAVAQGAVGVEIRDDDTRMRDLLAPLNDAPTALCVAAERAFLKRLDGSCRTPLAGLAERHGDDLFFRGMILSPDGAIAHEVAVSGPPANAVSMCDAAAQDLLDRAGPDFLKDTNT